MEISIQKVKIVSVFIHGFPQKQYLATDKTQYHLYHFSYNCQLATVPWMPSKQFIHLTEHGAINGELDL